MLVLRRSFFIMFALMVAGTLSVAMAATTSRTQQAKLRRLNACVGLIPTLAEPPLPSTAPPDPDALLPVRSPDPYPFVFEVLNQRTDIKPDGWEIVNPAAPAFATLEQSLRWTTIAGANALPQGTALRPDMAAYWEVPLNSSNYDRLVQMDVIYIPISRNNGTNAIATHFTEDQRRLLARLADAGVTLWVDWALDAATEDNMLGGNNLPGMAGDPFRYVRNPFFTNLDTFKFTGVATAPATEHPLLNGLFAIQQDALQIGRPYGNNGATPAHTNRAMEIRAPEMMPTCNFAAVVPVPSAGRAYVAGGRYGAGYIVATAGNVGGAIAGMIASNSVRITGQNLSLADAVDVKFAFNVFNWGNEVTDTRKLGREVAEGDGWIENFTYPHLIPTGGPGSGSPWIAYPPTGLAPGSLPSNPASPLVVDGVAIAATRFLTGPSTGESWINAFEVNPNNNWDGTGSVDDSIPPTTSGTALDSDYGIGLSYDRITSWEVPQNATINGMTVGDVPLGATIGSTPYVFAAGRNGIFSLPVPRPGMAAGWTALGVPTQPTLPFQMAYTGAPGFAILPNVGDQTRAQLYAGGIVSNPLFGAGSVSGKLMAYDVTAGNGALTPAWYYPPSQEANRMGAVAGPVTTAQVMDKATGTIDTMVFTTSVSPDAASGAQAGNAGDTTGKVEGWVTASLGEPLAFPVGNNAPGGNNPNAGRRFVAARWINIPPGQGQVPQARELLWDPTRHYEVRVMDKNQNYVYARYSLEANIPGFNLLPDGTAGQVELPVPPKTPIDFSLPGQPNVWNLKDFVLVADYSVLPAPVDNGAATIRPRFSPPTPYLRNIQQQVEPTGVAGGVAVGRDNLIYYGTGQGYMCASEWRRGRAQFRWKISERAPSAMVGSGLSQQVDPTAANYLQDFAFVAAPAAGKRIVFASKNTGSIYVFEPDATLRGKLLPLPNSKVEWNVAKAQEVAIQGNHGLGFVPNSPGLLSTQQPWGRVPGQFAVDPDTATVTFQNMENFALDLSSALSPQQVFQKYGVDTGGKPAVELQWWIRNPSLFTNPPTAGETLPTQMNPATLLVPIPLVAMYKPFGGSAVDPFLSSPVIANDRIYAMGVSGILYEIPLDPKVVDPSFPRPSLLPGLPGFNVGNTTLYPPNGIRRLRNISAGTGVPSIASPAISQGVLLANTPRGLVSYNSPSVVIADSNRIVEASGNSTTLASTNGVTKHRIDISEFAIPTDPSFASTGGRPILTERRLLNRPAAVKKLDRRTSFTALFNSSSVLADPVTSPSGIRQNPEWAEDSYIAADTGNNRVVEFNPAGKAVWECTEVYDPMAYLPPGETLKLNQPQDVQRWVETEIVNIEIPDPNNFGQVRSISNAPVYVIHTLIADTGNTRVLEVVDKVYYQQGAFNPGSFPVTPTQVGADGSKIRWYHVVVWSSQTNAQGIKLRYRTAQRIYWPSPTGQPIPVPGLPATPAPPYLPGDRYLSYTMATVAGQQVSYPTQNITPTGFFRFYGTPQQSVLDRVPIVRSGSDSVVFLRGQYKMDEGSGGAPVYVPTLREAPSGPSAADRFRFAQGVIDPNIPILTEIGDEVMSNGTLTSPSPVHRLSNVSSVQLTVRTDVKLAPETYVSGTPPRVPFFLIADADGVWEVRMFPNAMAPFHVALAFTNEDYAYVTGAGNGDPTKVFSQAAADHDPGGRRFNAASARRLPNGLLLITSRTTANEQPRVAAGTTALSQLNAGADVFLLRAADYLTADNRAALGAPTPYNRTLIAAHGWHPDQWVQSNFVPANLQTAPSIRWRAAELLDPTKRPSLNTTFEAGLAPNPPELTGSYIPVQPTFADFAY